MMKLNKTNSHILNTIVESVNNVTSKELPQYFTLRYPGYFPLIEFSFDNDHTYSRGSGKLGCDVQFKDIKTKDIIEMFNVLIKWKFDNLQEDIIAHYITKIWINLEKS